LEDPPNPLYEHRTGIFNRHFRRFLQPGRFIASNNQEKWGAVLSITFIGAEILGRIYLVMTGVAPSTGADAVKIVVAGAIALGLLVYIGLNRKPAAYTSSLPVLLFPEGCRFKFGMA
jgi:hypothetical protein